MRRFISRTVFNPIGKDWQTDKVLAVLFHRSAATLYLIYFFWGLSSIFVHIPSLTEEQNDIVQTAFAFLVIPTSLLAFVGATYFPKFARLEMYTAAALVTLIIIYEAFILIDFLNSSPSDGVNFILNLSHLIIPIARIVFIYVTLVKQAGGAK